MATGHTPFTLVSPFEPRGDQPRAIDELCAGIERGDRFQTLLGITGSGKTFTMGCVIERMRRPTLILAHNKTLAAQLYGEFKELFPDNAVHYFVSYYDYYQPEAYMPVTDTYIEKDALINEEIDRMRHAATHAILSRRDTIIVASVSCIYGIGSPDAYHGMVVRVHAGQSISREEVLRGLVRIQYSRNDLDFHRGTFRVRGDRVDVFPAYEEEKAIRLEFFGDTLESIHEFDPLRSRVLGQLKDVELFPSSHYVTPEDALREAAIRIRAELQIRLTELHAAGKLLEEQRLNQRTQFDLEMMEQMGHCSGIENYSRHLVGRGAGEPPHTLIDYFPRDFLMFIDESHQTIPQVQAMAAGDRSRKETLVEHGFRLPSAIDNRPLRFEEFLERIHQTIFVSATPGDWEVEASHGVVVEQLIRPTGLLDPEIEVRPITGQVDDLLDEIRERVGRGDRVLVTTLTKRMAEDLTEHYTDLGVRVRYLHSDIDTLERIEIIRALRQGEFDVLVGINLLREGLDLPEVSLVAILDADKEGFLRAERSLIQTIGRAARNVNGKVIMYADQYTAAMRAAIGETARRREVQRRHNEEHGVTPETVKRQILDLRGSIYEADYVDAPAVADGPDPDELPATIEELRAQMYAAAEDMAFEKAAALRDRIRALEQRDLAVRDPGAPTSARPRRPRRPARGKPRAAGAR